MQATPSAGLLTASSQRALALVLEKQKEGVASQRALADAMQGGFDSVLTSVDAFCTKNGFAETDAMKDLAAAFIAYHTRCEPVSQVLHDKCRTARVLLYERGLCACALGTQLC